MCNWNKGKVGVGFFIGLAMLLSIGACQKELTEGSLPPFCGPSQITISNGSAVLLQFIISYDSATRSATSISYTAGGGVSGAMSIRYTRDTIYLSNGTYLVKDAAGRIKFLNEAEGLLTDVGEFFYTYNQAGQLTERTFDDGVNEVERYKFSFQGEQLNKYNVDALGVTDLLLGELNYAGGPRISDYVLLQHFELLPELMPYAMLIKAGNLTPYPLTTNKLSINQPPQPPQSRTTTYSGYAQNGDGYPTAYVAALPSTQGTGTVSLSFNFEYRCYN